MTKVKIHAIIIIYTQYYKHDESKVFSYTLKVIDY